MLVRKLWHMIMLVALLMLPLAGCGGGGGGGGLSSEGYPVKFSGKVADTGKTTLKTLFAVGPDLGTLTILNAQDGSTLGSGTINSTGSFSNIAITLPSVKTVLVFKADVSLAGSPFRAIVPMDLSNPPAPGISASNSVNITISQDTTNIATAVSAMLGVTGVLGDAGATLTSVSKTFADASSQVQSNGGQVLAYNTSGLALTGQVSNAAMLPARDASTMTNDDLNNIVLDGKILSAFVPGKKPIVNFQVTNKATGKGISGLRTFGLHVAKLMPELNGSNSYWVNYIDNGIAIPAGSGAGATAATKPSADPGTSFNSDGSIKVKGYSVIDHGDGTYTATFASDITSNANAAYDGTLVHRIAITATSIAVPGVTATGPINPVTNTVNTSFNLANRLAMVYDFTPAANAAPLLDSNGKTAYARDIVTAEACNQCHYKITAILGHTGSRADTRVCVVCHTSKNTAGEGEFVTFIHRIHMGETLNEGGTFKPIAKGLVTYGEQTYPQDIRNCTHCHKGADVTNWYAKPTQKACGSCHNAVSFAATVPAGMVAHSGGAQPDDQCNTCHAANANIGALKKHLPIPPQLQTAPLPWHLPVTAMQQLRVSPSTATPTRPIQLQPAPAVFRLEPR